MIKKPILRVDLPADGVQDGGQRLSRALGDQNMKRRDFIGSTLAALVGVTTLRGEASPKTSYTLRGRSPAKIGLAEAAQKSAIIRFFGAVDSKSIGTLMTTVDKKLQEGTTRIVLLISSPGGAVFYGLSAYNYLKGIPCEVTTHNFGSVDSIGLILYCAGSLRLSVPQARFLLHPISIVFPPKTRFEENKIEEVVKSMKIDTSNIARVIASNSKKSVKDVSQAIRERTTLNPEEAKAWGLVHQIESELFEPGSDVISIQ